VKGVARVPSHRGWERTTRGSQFQVSPAPEESPSEDRFFNRPCYEFNGALSRGMDDNHCRHCRHYLTARCPHIDEFLDDVEDLEPD
jgi:hypothetical protein